MTSAKPKNSLGEVNSFLLALQDEQDFADSLRQAKTVAAEDDVLQSQGFNAEEIRKELQQVSFTDPVSSESVNLLSWMSIHCKLDNGSVGNSLSAFVNALSSERVKETISQSAELQNFAAAMRSLAGGTGSFTGSRSKISIADRIGDAGETKAGDNDGLNELESPREALSSERNGIEPGEMSVSETAGTQEGSGRESSRDWMTDQSYEKSVADAKAAGSLTWGDNGPEPNSSSGESRLSDNELKANVEDNLAGRKAREMMGERDDFPSDNTVDMRASGDAIATGNSQGIDRFSEERDSILSNRSFSDDDLGGGERRAESDQDRVSEFQRDSGQGREEGSEDRSSEVLDRPSTEGSGRDVDTTAGRGLRGGDVEMKNFTSDPRSIDSSNRSSGGQRGDAAEGSGSSRGSDGGIEMEDMNRDFGQSDAIEMDSRGANIATDDRQGVDNNQASDRGLRSRGDFGDGSREVMSRGTSGVSEDSRLDDSRSSTRSTDEGRGSDLDDSGMRDAFSSSAASDAVRDAKISERLNDSLEESGFGSEDSTELRLRNADNITEASYRANQDADSRRYRSTTEDRSDDSADDDLSERGGELSASDRDIADELMKEAGKPEGFANSADSFDDLKPGDGFTYQSSDGSWKTGIKGQAEDREMDDLGDETQVYKEERNFGDVDKSSELKSSNLSSETDELKTDEENLDELSGSSPTGSSGGGDGGDEPKETEPFDTVDV